MGASPLLGYNTNVRHAGRLYHIQTEDSGVTHGHIFTHLFADGGRIIASKKTTYAQHVGTSSYPEAVKQLMRESHKAMFIALRDGLFDEDEAAGAKAMAAMEIGVSASAAPSDTLAGADVEALERAAAKLEPAPEVDEDAFERAAAARLAESDVARAPTSGRGSGTVPVVPKELSGKYASTRPAAPSKPASRPARRPDPTSESIFGGDLLSEKSLDEVILSYLAEDVEED
ncbi:MAG: hypothetical protein AB7S26_42105 [Sandaracinaceae bacterium]